MSSEQNWLRRFKDSGTVWEYPGQGPHAAYEMANKHSGFYFNTDIVVSDAKLVTDICEFFAAVCAARGLRPDWIASYAASVSSSLVLAAKLAELLPARFGYLDLRQNVCHFHPAPGQNVLLITDDIHSGSSLAKTIELIEGAGGKITPAVLTMGNFSNKLLYKNMEIISLFDHSIDVYNPDECPLCKAGSKAIPARQMWAELMRKSSI